MLISKIELVNFRNYKYLLAELDKNINLFYGDNSSGKTNIIEAIYYGGMIKSFRCNSEEYLVNYSSEFFKIVIDVKNENNMSTIYSVEYNKKTNRRIIKKNEKNIRKLADLIGKIPIILFSPEDIYMIKGEPVLRRKFIDNIIIKANTEYYELISNYNKILLHRNNILKLIKEKKINKNEINPWNIQLLEYSQKIVKHRIETIEILNKIIQGNFSKNNIVLNLKYKIKGYEENKWKDYNEYFNFFIKNKFYDEIIRAITLIGPHRDDIEIYLQDRPVKFFGSEGQQRLSCIILKLAEGLFIKEKNNVYPIVLLDDFTSELDDINKNFIGEIFDIFKQIIITTTSKENLKNIKIDKCFLLKDGEIKKIE